MSRIHLGNMISRAVAALSALVLACLLVACAKLDLSPDQLPLTKDTMMLLGKKGMDPQSPIFLLVFKEESELEIWKQSNDGRFCRLKPSPICSRAGSRGPKVKC